MMEDKEFDNKTLPEILGTYRFNSKINNWFGTDSYAQILFKPKDENDLANFLKNFPDKEKINIIGAASNIIFKNKITDGVVVKLSANFAKITKKDNFINAGAASLCRNVAFFSKDNSLANLEFLSGIPGTVGGAIAMNAGCYGNEISDFLIEAEAVDVNGNFVKFNNKDFDFHYRGSDLIKQRSKELIFLSAKFNCKPTPQELIAKKIDDLVANREKSQPIRAKTGGSTFKNPPHCKAWELIDKAGFRGKEVSNVKVSDKHCNFLINSGNASGQDIINLIEEIQNEVLTKFDTVLEVEIKII